MNAVPPPWMNASLRVASTSPLAWRQPSPALRRVSVAPSCSAVLPRSPSVNVVIWSVWPLPCSAAGPPSSSKLSLWLLNQARPAYGSTELLAPTGTW
ncbi:Uncharacterised protein [Bordetella pertussis]|nr:Uncharacterised protein [Bordetella pertussis]